MPFPDPAQARKRDDLPFLRHRGRVGTSEPPVPTAALASAAGANELDLDLGSATSASASPSTTRQATGPATTPAGRSASEPAVRGFRRRRTSRQAATFVTPEEPTVTLTRIQSGVGALTIEAACSEAIGDFRLGALYALRSGVSSIVQFASQLTLAPSGSGRPVITASHGKRYQQLTIDLRQSVELIRLLIYLVPGTLAPVNWSGALVVTTFGGARIEMPITTTPSTHMQILLSVFNVTGEYVMRAEAIDIPGDLRNSAAAFGFDRIAWLDGQTPVL